MKTFLERARVTSVAELLSNIAVALIATAVQKGVFWPLLQLQPPQRRSLPLLITINIVKPY